MIAMIVWTKDFILYIFTQIIAQVHQAEYQIFMSSVKQHFLFIVSLIIKTSRCKIIITISDTDK